MNVIDCCLRSTVFCKKLNKTITLYILFMAEYTKQNKVISDNK